MAIRATALLAIFSVLLVSCGAQMLRQCTCAEYAPCSSSSANLLIPCADQCQRTFASLGASYPALRQCIVQRSAQINQVIGCVTQTFSTGCAMGAPQMLPKRYSAGFDIALMSEANRIASISGVTQYATSILGVAKKSLSCVRRCVEKKAMWCKDRFRCELALPTDTVLVQGSMQCARQAGLLNTPTMQQICYCALNAGIRQLAPICPRIRI